MITSKPFSTISYNSVKFLKVELEKLLRERVIVFYAFIEDLPEDDEKKKHIHLYLVPKTKMDTDYINNTLVEFDKKHPDLPLGCIPCRSSKFGDWFMYNLHDKNYLLSKGQSRKYFYEREDFVVSDQTYFLDEVYSIDRSKYVGSQRVKEAVDNGCSFEDLVYNGQIPVQLISQYRFFYDILKCRGTFRNGRETHTPKEVKMEERTYLIDEETGEVIHNPFYEEKQG